jgi:hypothetical protein
MKKLLLLSIALILFSGFVAAQDIIQENSLSISLDGNALFDSMLSYKSKELSDAAKGLISLNKSFFEESLKKQLAEKLDNVQITYENLDSNDLLSISINGNAGKMLAMEGSTLTVKDLLLSSKSQGYQLKATQSIILPANSEVTSIEPKNFSESMQENRKRLEWVAENGAELSINLSFKLAQEKNVLGQASGGNVLFDYGIILLIIIGVIIALIVLIKSVKRR